PVGPKGEGAPAKPVVIKKFDPKSDKLFQSDVSGVHAAVDGDGWRVDRKSGGGPLAIHLFDFPKQDLRGYAVQLRFKMRMEKVAGYSLVELRLGGTSVVTKNDVSATTDWKNYELTSEVRWLALEDIDIYAGVNGTGTIWLKDVELVKIPRP